MKSEIPDRGALSSYHLYEIVERLLTVEGDKRIDRLLDAVPDVTFEAGSNTEKQYREERDEGRGNENRERCR